MAVSLKSIFSEVVLLSSLFIYFGLILSNLSSVLQNASWSDTAIWIAFGKTCVQNAVVVLMGIVSYMTKRIVQTQNDSQNLDKDKQLTDANSKLQTISNTYLKMQVAAMNSTDPTLKQACANGAMDLINAGVSLFNLSLPGDTNDGNSGNSSG